MTELVESADPESGEIEWVEDDELDLHQEIASASYGDMLHDHERNEKYYLALEKAIKKTKSMGKQANVLDIGTGTGLLSMMAARLGADSIVACEAFTPMAKCAKEIIAENGFADRIHVVPKRSTQMIVGPNGDMKNRANILVTEVFDSDFIGDGALLTFRHALEELLEEDSIVVPSSGRVYVEVVESKLARRWNRLNDWNVDEDKTLKVPKTLHECPGTYSVHDLQMSQFPTDQFTVIVPPQVIFSFDFLGKTKLEYSQRIDVPCVAETSGTAQAVFMWWDLTMDTDDDILLSCAPHWAHPSPEAKSDPESIPWRDHWIQEIYYLPNDVHVTAEDKLKLISCHDQYGFWFDLVKNENTDFNKKENNCIRPACTCNLHVICSYTRIGMLNDPLRREKYVSALKKKVKSDSIVLSIGDCSLIGLLAACIGAKKVYCQDVSIFSKPIIDEFIKTNGLSDIVKVLPINYDSKGCYTTSKELKCILPEVDLIVTEPFFNAAYLPWHNIQWKPSGCSETCSVIPTNASIWAAAVQFDHLYKIKAPLKEVFNFSMRTFDQLIADSNDLSNNPIEMQPLWEYGTVSLSQPFELFDFNLNNEAPEKDKYFQTALNIEHTGRFDAITLWIEYKLDGDTTISSGPITELRPLKPGEKVVWDMYTRQPVCFMKRFPVLVNNNDTLLIQSIFQSKTRDVLLNVDLKHAGGDVYKNLNGPPSSKFDSFKTECNEIL